MRAIAAIWVFVLTMLALALLLAGAAHGQTSYKDASPFPRPYVAGGLSLMPAGYAAAAWRIQGGLYWTAPHALADVFAAYDNGTKENDGTVDNIKGHDRYLHGFLFYKQGNTYFGGGATWNQLSTTNYDKGISNPISALATGDFHPAFGGGHDWLGTQGSLRAQAVYLLPPPHESVSYPGQATCWGCGNGVQGVQFSLFFPSPARSGHWFFRIEDFIGEYHDTITDPTNIPLRNSEDSSRHVMDTVDFMLMYRF